MNPKQQYKEKFAAAIIKQMEKRQFEACYCATKEDALAKVQEYLTEPASVTWGGSETFQEIGALDWVKEQEHLTVLDRYAPRTKEERQEYYSKAINADYFFMSANAITMDGQLVNIDGVGNRVGFLCFGPRNVLVVASLNKVARDVDSAIFRVRNMATPPNAIRLDYGCPCGITGKCEDCLSPNCMCAQIVTTRFSRVPGRIKVILVGEELGY